MASVVQAMVARSMAILYAGMMLLGPSLHVHLHCEHELLSPHCPAHHGHGCCECEPLTLNTLDADHGHDKDCPVCQFHSQGQLADAAQCVALRVRAQEFLTPHAAQCPDRRIPGLYSPRAPPGI